MEKRRFGFYFDQTKCIGCNACQMACKDYYDVERGLFYRRVETIEFEIDGKNYVENYSGACNHCSNAACVRNCPTGAMHFNDDKTVGHDYGLCIGCGTCTWACPYGAPKLSYKKGVAQKCTSCYERRKDGKMPVCVEACITHCLQFVDLETVHKEKGLYSDTTPYLPESDLTTPSLIIRRKKNE